MESNKDTRREQPGPDICPSAFLWCLFEELMKQHSNFMAALVAALLVSASSGAQTKAAHKSTTHKKTRKTAAHSTRARKPVESAAARQMRELQEQMAGQQAQIDALKTQLSARDQQVAAAQQSAAEAQSQVATAATATAAAAAQSTQNAQDVQQLKTSVGDLSAKDDTLTETVVKNQAQVQDEINSPTTLHYKGITIQPVAFFALEGVWRQRSVNSDINTPFNTIPFPSSTEGHVSELNFSGRQSRLGGLFTGDAGKFKLAGYFESDFLGAGVTSNNNQSNSYVLRQRQIWGQIATAGGFTMTGGQMWSLVTENSHGTDNRTEILPNTVDPQYMVGFNWTRQPGLRLQQRFGTAKTGATIALALEQAQITNFTATSATSSAVPTNFYFAGAGQNGGLYNAFNGTYANNVAPDVILKAAYDFPKMHVEVGGLARFMRDYYYPITSATAATNLGAVTYVYGTKAVSSTSSAGGAFGAIRVQPMKVLEVGVQAMAGTGVGRYGSAQLADATLKPSGALEPIKNYHGLFSLVTHPGKNLDVYAYYGGEYDQRTIYSVAGSNQIGYGAFNLNDTNCYSLPVNPGSSTGGSPAATGSCASPTRYIQEGMFGLTYRAVNSPKYGRLQYQFTYSYLQRNLWSGSVPAGSVAGPRAEDGMVHAGMRYYIP